MGPVRVTDYIVCPRCHRHVQAHHAEPLPVDLGPSTASIFGLLVTAFSLGIVFACVVLLMTVGP
jgi:hypothetical protein